MVWHPSSRKFIESKNVRFLEKLIYKDVYSRENSPSEITHFTIESQSNEQVELREKDYSMQIENSEKEKTKPRERGRPNKENKENKENELENIINKDTPVTRSKTKRKSESVEQIIRTLNAKKEEDISCIARNASVLEIDEMAHDLLSRIQKNSSNFDKTMKSSERELWKEAIREELNSMKINNV